MGLEAPLMNDYVKHLLVRTPLEKPALLVGDMLKFGQVVRHPGLFNVLIERAVIRSVIPRLVVQPNANCIDVGAHLGSMLSLFLELAPNGRHMAFEPMPEKAGWLRKKFPEVEVHAKALGGETGQAEFAVNRTRTSFSGLRPFGEVSERYATMEVEIARLDDLVPQDRNIAFLKVVVEGAELSVLQGAQRVLRDSRPSLILESSAQALEAWGLEPREVYAFLADYDYELRTPLGFLRGSPALSFSEYASAQQYPFKSFKFVATSR